MAEEKRGDTSNGSYNQLERLDWLIQSFDKLIDRYSSGFSSLNQKATWTLATATGFAAITGFTKGVSFVAVLRNEATSIDSIALVIFILFALVYLALLRDVIEVYSPQSVEYPVSPMLKRPISQCEDQDEYVEECWNYTKNALVKPEELKFLESVLLSYIHSIVLLDLRNKKMGKHLKSAFQLLPVLATLSLILWFLA